MSFIDLNDRIINIDSINFIDCTRFLNYKWVRVHYKNENTECVYGNEAVNLIMRVCPNYLEGKRMSYIRHAWTVHNMIGHPLMQILSWFGLKKLAIRVHDSTIPFPEKLV